MIPTQRKRSAAMMGAYAMTHTFTHHASDQRDAHNMSVFERLRGHTHARARQLMLAGIKEGKQ